MKNKLFELLYLKITGSLIKNIWLFFNFAILKKFIFPIIDINNDKYLLSLSEVCLTNQNHELVKDLSLDACKALNLSKKFNFNKSITKNRKYIHSLESLLSKDSFDYILSLCSDENIIKHAKKYLGSQPYLSGVQVYGNTANETSSLKEGSKLWHRDSYVLHQAEYYINLTKVKNRNGELQIIKSSQTNWLLFPETKKKEGWANGYRYTDKEMSDFYTSSIEELITTNAGEIGLVTFLDSGFNFHRGGDIKKGDRIVVRISFHTNPYHAKENLKNKINEFKGYKENVVYKYRILNHMKRLDDKYISETILFLYRILIKLSNRLRIYKKI